MWVHKHYFYSKMVLDIPNGPEDMDKEKEEDKEVNLKKKVVTALINQPVDCIKHIDRPITLTMAIQNIGLTNQKLNAIIIKR